MMQDSRLLNLVIFLPTLFAAALLFLPKTEKGQIRVVALIAMLLSSLALGALLLSPRPLGMAFAALLAIRCVQGTAAAIMLSLAQGASAGSARPVAALARVQIGPGLGRALGAALIGPMLKISVALPVLPVLIGTAAGLRRLRHAGPDALGPDALATGRHGPRAPWLAALAVPFLVQSAVGAGQLGLGPLLAQTRPPEQAATIAGLCLAAGYLALLLVHYRWTGRGTAARPAAALLIVALILPALSAAPVVLVAATARDRTRHGKARPCWPGLAPARGAVRWSCHSARSPLSCWAAASPLSHF